MGKRDNKRLLSGKSSFQSPKFDQNELKHIEKARKLLLPIKKKYNVQFSYLLNLLEEKVNFPVSILIRELTVLGSVVKYLKEEKNLSYRRIADLIGRDERNVWNIYRTSRQRSPARFSAKREDLWIPVSVLSQTRLSALESVVAYLKDLSFTHHKIAILLKRDDRTVWTAYHRASKKRNEKTR